MANIFITFDDMRTICKHYSIGFDQDRNCIPTCRHKDNKPVGCSWGDCNEQECPLIKSGKPSARIGKWLHKNDDHFDWLECPFCEYGSEGEVKYGRGTPFCPQCGADLTEGQEA